MPMLGFTPVCTVAKELAVALASNHLTKTENFQAHTFTATEESCLIISGQCYIREVRAESVCASSPLRMVSDSGTINIFEVKKLKSVFPVKSMLSIFKISNLKAHKESNFKENMTDNMYSL